MATQGTRCEQAQPFRTIEENRWQRRFNSPPVMPVLMSLLKS